MFMPGQFISYSVVSASSSPIRGVGSDSHKSNRLVCINFDPISQAFSGLLFRLITGISSDCYIDAVEAGLIGHTPVGARLEVELKSNNLHHTFYDMVEYFCQNSLKVFGVKEEFFCALADIFCDVVSISLDELPLDVVDFYSFSSKFLEVLSFLIKSSGDALAGALPLSVSFVDFIVEGCFRILESAVWVLDLIVGGRAGTLGQGKLEVTSEGQACWLPIDP